MMGISYTAEAQWTDTATYIEYRVTDFKQVEQFRKQILMPKIRGVDESGNAQTYNGYQDRLGILTLYCSQSKSPICKIRIAKDKNSDGIMVQSDGLHTVATVFDQDEAKTLFNSILTKSLIHGDHEMKTVTDKNVYFSLSCLKSLRDNEEITCYANIFKPESQF